MTMLQRKEFETLVELIGVTHPGRCTSAVMDVLAHDQAQRAVIEEARRTAEYWKAEHLAGNEKIHQQAMGIIDLRECIDRQATTITEYQVENKALREALQLLYDTQNGCPLPKYTDDWGRAMELAQRALKEEP